MTAKFSQNNRKGKQRLITNFFSGNKDIQLNISKEYFAKKDYKNIRKDLQQIKLENPDDRNKTWDGYLFTAYNSCDNYFEYSVKTLIPRKRPQGDYVYESGYEVASATIDDDHALTHIVVKPDFRRRKIGTQLIRFINDCCEGKFNVFGGSDNNSRYRLTEEGACLINYCLGTGILKYEQYISDTVPKSPIKSPS